ncbi:MAG: CDP-alcohol phosphatidyltransferase family protein [Candidatus Poribacteria bacterium]|nr:CDP-alcohol phosphatidyltransferase family protein [Candidatus Poribacteria bacterium]
MNFHPFLRLANLLTFSRLLLTLPFFFFFRAKLMLPAAIIFGLAALTDYLDGIIARKQGVTSFGSFMDSIVDKILVGTALISFYLFQPEHLDDGVSLIPIWMVLVILGREVIVTALRILCVAKHGEVISANRWGKYKTTSQVIVITISLVLLVFFENSQYVVQPHGPIYFMMYLPLVLTVASGLEFVYGNRKAFTV